MRHSRRTRRPALALPIILGALLAVLFTIVAARVAADKPSAEHTPLAVETLALVSAEAAQAPEHTAEAVRETAPQAASRYAGVEISEEDVYTLACLVYHEARGESLEGQIAVVEVVLNRCISDEFPDTVEEVVFQKYGDVWQFSPAPYIWTAEPGAEQYEAVETARSETEYILTEETVYFSTAPYNDHISAIIGNHYFCEIGG